MAILVAVFLELLAPLSPKPREHAALILFELTVFLVSHTVQL